MNNIKTMISRKFSVEQCRTNPKVLFVFGDNGLREGVGGQAVIRGQVNAIGIITKINPGMNREDFFSDTTFEENCKLIDEDIERVKAYAKEGNFEAISFAKYGIGTGLALLPKVAPKTFLYLSDRLLTEFSFNNIEFLKSE